jgi:hypothetical protein
MVSDAPEASAQSRYARANGLNIYYQEHGTGHPLVLLQQGFDTSQVWRFALPVWEPELAAAYVFMSAWLWNAKARSQRGLVVMQDHFGIEQPVREQLTENDLERVEQKRHYPKSGAVGDRDPFIPLNETVEFYQHLPNAELAVIPRMGHEALSCEHAPLVSQIILDFLR